VNQGDTLDTYMYPESVTHCPAGWGQWQIGINVNGYNVIGFSTCTWQNGYNWAFGNVLEVHGGNGCADLPQADYGVSTSGLYVLVNGFSGNQAPSTWQPDIYSTWPFCSQNASGSGANGSMWWIDHN
jgi:hypothetical protein